MTNIESGNFPQGFSLPLEYRRGIRNASSSRRLEANGKSEIHPLYRGFGTHFAFIWIGSPPQRVSVIVDTGSHFTAFPCVGCNCGKHMDSYFDPVKSSTSKILQCGGKCFFSQSYSEGSSWRAFKTKDLVWVSGSKETMVKSAKEFAVEFTFGCQESETGRTAFF